MKNAKRIAVLVCAAVWLYGCGSDSAVTVLDPEDTGVENGITDSETIDTENTDTGSTDTETGIDGSTDNTSNESDNEDTADNSSTDDSTADNSQQGFSQNVNEATYRATFNATWSVQTHPTNFPADPHFSPLTGAVHNVNEVIWQRGDQSSPGIVEMAETGGTDILLTEIQVAMNESRVLSAITGGGIATSPGTTSVEFVVDRDHPYVTLVSMVAPSPDWFVGVDSLEIVNPETGNFLESRTIVLNVYDAGSDSGLRFESANSDTQPREPIALVNSFPADSDLVEGQPSVGQLVVERIQ